MSRREGRSDVGVMSWKAEEIERGLDRFLGEAMERARVM